MSGEPLRPFFAFKRSWIEVDEAVGFRAIFAWKFDRQLTHEFSPFNCSDAFDE